MSASPYGRICMTSGRKTANRLTRAVPGTHGHESGRVAREGRRRAGCPARLDWAGSAVARAHSWARSLAEEG